VLGVNETGMNSAEDLDRRDPGQFVPNVNSLNRFRSSIFVPIFLLSLTIPLVFYLGAFRLSPYRLFLLLFFIPLFVSWISGAMGKIRLPDVLILGSVLWSGMSLMIHHGVVDGGETAGLLIIESFGAYLLARKYIRNAQSFRAMVRFLFFLILVFIPFAIGEAITRQPIFLDLTKAVFGGAAVLPPVDAGVRFGLRRVQMGFDHPILFGAFCAMAIGLAYYVLGYKKSGFGKLVRGGLMVFATIWSVSSGALAAVAVQLIFIAWEKFTRKIHKRWRLFSMLSVAAYIVIDVLSNRSPFHVIVTYLTFGSASSYNRILIWRFGSAEVWRNPIIGIGQNDWIRPSFMSASLDNFWLYIAMVYGIPAFLFFAGAIYVIIRRLAYLEIDDAEIRAMRAGLLVSLGGMIVAGATVHYWNASYSAFMFLVGCGLWMFEQDGARKSKNNKKTNLSRLG